MFSCAARAGEVVGGDDLAVVRRRDAGRGEHRRIGARVLDADPDVGLVAHVAIDVHDWLGLRELRT